MTGVTLLHLDGLIILWGKIILNKATFFIHLFKNFSLNQVEKRVIVEFDPGSNPERGHSFLSFFKEKFYDANK